MKIASTVARYLLGLIFLIFGLNGFLHFLPSPVPPGIAGQFLGALFVSHFLAVVFLLELIPAILLLLNRFVPLALVLLGPVIVNIVLFHALMALRAGCRWPLWLSSSGCLPRRAFATSSPGSCSIGFRRGLTRDRNCATSLPGF